VNDGSPGAVVGLIAHARNGPVVERERLAPERLGRDVDGHDERAVRDLFAL
jgi:hypothetical protein